MYCNIHFLNFLDKGDSLEGDNMPSWSKYQWDLFLRHIRQSSPLLLKMFIIIIIIQLLKFTSWTPYLSYFTVLNIMLWFIHFRSCWHLVTHLFLFLHVNVSYLGTCFIFLIFQVNTTIVYLISLSYKDTRIQVPSNQRLPANLCVSKI